MADHDDSKDSERDSDSDEDRDSDSEVESEPKPAKVEPKKAGKGRAGAGRAAAAVPAPSSSVPSSRVGLFVALALAAGAAGGWFGHIQQAKAALKADSAAAPVGSGVPAGPCGVWQTKVCSGAGGDKSAACMQAKAALDLLTPSTCEAAITALPVTLAKLKAARASCDKLVSKLCGDLKTGSQTCAMVKDKTPSFPAQRCDEMLSHYDEVIGELKRMDEQGGMPMGGPGGPHGGPGGPGPGMSSPH
ncbi:MAG TPA: hypothetical protein VNG33_08530 [Polyangiaceae bacterium]|nr:hypothetical protein [Polyangiaceae bacterium]